MARESETIRPCAEADFGTIYEIVNDAAEAYRGIIPADRFREPYMAREELRAEIDAGVRFWGTACGGRLDAVMGVQDVGDVTLFRHAYVRTASRRRGIGGRLLRRLRADITRPVLIGTWTAADWAIRFYEKHGFERLPAAEIAPLLRRYWSIPERQVETSVVLGDAVWCARRKAAVWSDRPT